MAAEDLYKTRGWFNKTPYLLKSLESRLHRLESYGLFKIRTFAQKMPAAGGFKQYQVIENTARNSKTLLQVAQKRLSVNFSGVFWP